MSDSGILYMIVGRKHHPVLVVSIFSLRKHWQGPVHIAAGDEAGEEIAKLICHDDRLHGKDGRTTWERWSPPTEPRGATYYSKCWMQELSPFDQTVFLDADTIIEKPLDVLFEFDGANSAPMRTRDPGCFSMGGWRINLTRFASWPSNGRKITGRLKPWAVHAPFDYRTMTTQNLPAINTGVVSFDKSEQAGEFFRDWKETCKKNVSFICDELAAQLIFHRHAVRVVDARWNASPIHCDDATNEAAVVRHFHGRKHVNRWEGRRYWLPVYNECVRENIAQIAEWTPGSDRRLREWLESQKATA